VDVVPESGDHDFHVVSLTPSVTLLVDFDGSQEEEDGLKGFYGGQAHVCLKDSIFQPSNAERHAVEFGQLLTTCPLPTPAIFVMTDGGPDHNCNHLSVRMSWLGYFLQSGMDMLVVHRAAPTQSWTNPAERVMGPLNLAMQNMALARKKMDDSFEDAMRRCHGMSAVRVLQEQNAAAASLSDQSEATPPLQQSNATTSLSDQPEPTPPQKLPIVAASLADRHEPTPPQQPIVDPNTDLLDSDFAIESNGELCGGTAIYIDSDSDSISSLDDEDRAGESHVEPQAPIPPEREVPAGFHINTYRESIGHVLSAIERQIVRSTWAGTRIKVHPPAKDNEVSASRPFVFSAPALCSF
jgi:hypothetical protein